MNNKKRLALVTGASRGIGFAIAKKLLAEGLEVLTPGRQEMDLSSPVAIEKYLNNLKRSVDVLVNNAGINLLGSVLEIDEKNISETVQVNLLTPLQLVRAVVPGMIKNNYGRIVNISSIWGIITKPRRLTYSLTKSGLIGMTRTLAVELAPYNILVNAVAPGYVNTELTRQNNTEQELEIIRKSIPIQRLAEPSEIAEVVAFLCSEKNTYITGQVIVVDGGFTCL